MRRKSYHQFRCIANHLFNHLFKLVMICFGLARLVMRGQKKVDLLAAMYQPWERPAAHVDPSEVLCCSAESIRIRLRPYRSSSTSCFLRDIPPTSTPGSIESGAQSRAVGWKP
jgi:hypothetical protein